MRQSSYTISQGELYFSLSSCLLNFFKLDIVAEVMKINDKQK